MSERRYLNVYNMNGEFMFGLFNSWGDYMTDVADLKLRLFDALSDCSPDCTQLEALAYLMASGFEVNVSTNFDDWYRSEEEGKALTEMFSENCGGREILYTFDVLEADPKLRCSSEYTFKIGETFRPIDLIWEEEDLDECDEEELEQAIDMPPVMFDFVTKENVENARRAIGARTFFYKHDGLYYRMN